MEDPVHWLESAETCDCDQSTVGSAWSLLRKAWGCKKSGNCFIPAEKLQEAEEQYSSGLRSVARAVGLVALESLETEDPFEHRDFQRTAKLVEGALHRNLSLTAQRQGNYTAALRHADASLLAEPGNLKSKYRRALALLHLNRESEADANLREVLAKEPQNMDARRLLQRVQRPLAAPTPATPSSTEADRPQPHKQKTCHCGICELWADKLSADTAADLLQSGGAKMLLARRDSRGRTALHLAVMQEEANPNASSQTSAACGRCQGLVEALIDAGAEVELTDEDERTPLHLAALEGRPKAVSLLLDAGCLPDTLDRFGRSPLYYAAAANHRDVVALLTDRGHADQSILFHALKEKFGTHNFVLHDWPEYNGCWMSSKEGRLPDLPLRPV
ncbi:ANKRD50, partial [Symbiodinium pilosum]